MSDKTERLNLQLKQFLPYRLNVLARRISSSLSTIYTKEFGITIPEWRVLLWLNTYPNLYAKDICAYTYMDKTQVSRLITQLEKRAFIQRKTCKNDNRSYQLSLTQQGKDLLDVIIPKAIEWEDSLIDSISSAEYQNLLSMVEKLEKQLDKLNQSEWVTE